MQKTSCIQGKRRKAGVGSAFVTRPVSPNLGLTGFPRKSYTVISDVYAYQTRQAQVRFPLRVTLQTLLIKGFYTTRIERSVTYALQLVRRAVDPLPSPVQNMGVYHRRLHALVAEQFLDCRGYVSAWLHAPTEPLARVRGRAVLVSMRRGDGLPRCSRAGRAQLRPDWQGAGGDSSYVGALKGWRACTALRC